MTPTELAVDLWKTTLDAHDRQWATYTAVAFGVLAFLTAFQNPRTSSPLLRRALFFGVAAFMAVSGVTMWENLNVHNDATAAIRSDPALGAAPAFASVGRMDPVKNTAVHLVFDVALLCILWLSLFRPTGDAADALRAAKVVELGCAHDPSAV